ncbi:putative nucleic acid-binding protein [Opitutaceae bacterium TAV1]|nr:putative nucleic acid-binding protein [Opitutaceae bacterium TAV1]
MQGSSGGRKTCPRVKDSTVNYLLDAGPLVALLSETDMYHEWARSVLTVLDEPLYTTEAVVTEASHLLRKLRPALQVITLMVQGRRLRLVPTLSDDAERIGQMLQKYPQMDMADATLVALSERYPRAKLITIDRTDFTVYRRKDGKAVPPIMPPE